MQKLGHALLGKASTTVQYIRYLQNWPQTLRYHIVQEGLRSLRLRHGPELHMLDPQAEIWAFRSIWLEQCYNRDFRSLDPGGNIVDLGANIGLFTTFAAQRLVPRGKVLGIEPYTPCFERLTENVTDLANVTIRQAAVCGSGELWAAADSLGASIFRSAESREKVECETVTAEWVLRYFESVELLKANMEGAEYPFLEDSRDEWWHGVRRVAIKWHDGEVAQGHKPEELRSRLEFLGYRVLRHEEIWREPGLTTGITTAERPR